MSKEAQIDVEMEVPVNDYLVGDEAFARGLIEKMREKADAEARLAGGTLRTDRLPELNTMRATSPIFGGDLLLVASRWWVEVPESFDPGRASAASR